jgi:hypothetical protein
MRHFPRATPARLQHLATTVLGELDANRLAACE